MGGGGLGLHNPNRLMWKCKFLLKKVVILPKACTNNKFLVHRQTFDYFNGNNFIKFDGNLHKSDLRIAHCHISENVHDLRKDISFHKCDWF